MPSKHKCFKERSLLKWKLLPNMTIIEFPSLQIFNTYMQCNLGAPDGIRKAEGEDGGEEIGETEEDDRLRFKGRFRNKPLGIQLQDCQRPLKCVWHFKKRCERGFCALISESSTSVPGSNISCALEIGKWNSIRSPRKISRQVTIHVWNRLGEVKLPYRHVKTGELLENNSQYLFFNSLYHFV